MEKSSKIPDFHKLLKQVKPRQKKFDASKSEKNRSDPEKTVNKFNTKQFKALEIANKWLPICPEASLVDFPVHPFVEELVNILKQQDLEKSDPNLWSVAMKLLIQLCNMFSASNEAVVSCNGLTLLVDLYTQVEDEELAKQCLQTLVEISEVYPIACLETRVLMPVLECRRSLVLKHITLPMAWNILKELTLDTAEYGRTFVPMLTQYLHDPDTKVVEVSSICLNKIVKTLAPQMRDEVLKSHGFISQAAALISCRNSGGRQASLNTSAYTALVLLLSTCASSSHLGSELLLRYGITGILKDILTGSGIFPALSRPQEQILDIVNLANDLLSPLFLPVIPEEQHDSIATEAIAHEKLPEKQLLQQFGLDLLPVLMQICGSSLNGAIPRKCLSVIAKLMHFSSDSMINSLSSVNISRFLAGVLARKDPQVLVSALQIADTLINKFPAMFSKMFVREGVLQAVNTIIKSGSPDVAFPQSSSCEVDSFKHSGLAVSSPPNPIEVPTSSIFVDVISSAEALKVSYSKYCPESVDAISKELQLLKSLCFKLITFDNQTTISKGSKEREDMATPIISEILTTLSEGDCSTFEFIESGVVDAFLGYLSCGFYSKENISEFAAGMYHEQVTRRCKSFIEVARPLGLQDKEMAPMSILVKYLQSALSSLERFPVVLSHGGARELLEQEKNDTPFKRNAKTVLNQKDESGAHMRIDARRGAAVDKASQMKIDEASDDISDDEDQDDVCILNRKLPCDLDKSDSTYNILALLCVLEGLNKSSSNLHGEALAGLFCEGKMSSLNYCTEIDGIIPCDMFINNQLTLKLAGQVEDALALRSKSLPSWCCQLTKACPFLFPFEIRRHYFYLTVFSTSRALHHLALHRRRQNGHESKKKTGEKKTGVRVGRLRHLQVRVSRDSILDTAAQVMKMDDTRKYVLEVDFFDKVDTGLEPTLEFYTLLVLELQKVGLEMWRLNNASVNSMIEVEEKNSKGNMAFDALIQAPCGLFPRPWPLDADLSDGSAFKKVVGHFKLLGCVLGKALQDKRPLDVSFSSAFYKLLLGQDLNLHDIISFDPELGKNLLKYQALVDVKLYPGLRCGNNEVAEIQFSENENANEDPGRDFTLPDFPFPEKVYINNLEKYIAFVIDVTTGSGIKRQLEALRAGFNEVFDISSLKIFSAKELEYMLRQRK